MLVRVLRGLVADAPVSGADRGDYVQNRWAAARFGLDAELIHPDGESAVSARELAGELLGAEPPEPEALIQLSTALPAADLVARTVA